MWGIFNRSAPEVLHRGEEMSGRASAVVEGPTAARRESGEVVGGTGALVHQPGSQFRQGFSG